MPMPLKAKNISKLSARDYSVFLLSLNLQSEGQLREKLSKKKFLPADIDDAISYLKELRYLNDKEFGRIYFENLKKYKNFGFYGIKKKLHERKLAPALIEKLMRDFSVKDEVEIAMRLLTKYKTKTPEQRTRALLSRGFRNETIFKATKKDPEID